MGGHTAAGEDVLFPHIMRLHLLALGVYTMSMLSFQFTGRTQNRVTLCSRRQRANFGIGWYLDTTLEKNHKTRPYSTIALLVDSFSRTAVGVNFIQTTPTVRSVCARKGRRTQWQRVHDANVRGNTEFLPAGRSRRRAREARGEDCPKST